MDRSWIHKTLFTAPYMSGVNQFMGFVRQNFSASEDILCPCRGCINFVHRSQSDVEEHLMIKGMASTYTRWYFHGEALSDDEGDNGKDSSHKSDFGDFDQGNVNYGDDGPSMVGDKGKKRGCVSEDIQIAYTAKEDKRRKTQSEGMQPMSDAKIVDEVLKEQSASSTFLASMGYASSSRSSASSTSAARIQDIEERLEQKEIEARDANERCHQELSARLKAQERLIEDMTRKQREELDAFEKSFQDKMKSFEKKQQEMETVLNYILRSQATQEDAPMHKPDGT